MYLRRFSRLVIVTLAVIAVASSSAPALCAEAATQEQNLSLLKRIEADLAKKPDNTHLQLQHAEVLGLLKHYEEQIAEASRLIAKNPKLIDAHLIRSDGEANQKRYSEALVSLDKAICLGASNPELLMSKSRYLMHLKRYDEAIKCFGKVIDLEPSNGNAYHGRAICYMNSYGPCAEALRDMEKVALLRPSDDGAKKMIVILKRELALKPATSASHSN
jgi:tetratricopeptide (TPR) repeat protein